MSFSDPHSQAYHIADVIVEYEDQSAKPTGLLDHVSPK